MTQKNNEFEKFEFDKKKLDNFLSYLQIKNKYFKYIVRSIWYFIYSFFTFIFFVLLYNIVVVGRDYSGNMQGEWLELGLYLSDIVPILQFLLLIYFGIIGYKNRDKFKQDIIKYFTKIKRWFQ